MKFGYAWTFVNKPRGERPAPPEKRTPALPRPPACRLDRGIRIGPPRSGEACAGQLGGARIWFGYLERRVSTRREHACLPEGTAKHRGICWRTQECLLRFKRTRHYASRHHVKIRYISRRRLSWLMTAWLTRAPPSIFTASSCVFCYSSLEFYCSKSTLNISEYFVLTDAGARRRRPTAPVASVLCYSSMCCAFNPSSKNSCYITSKSKVRLSGLCKPPGAPIWRVNVALIRTRTEAAGPIRYEGRYPRFKAPSGANTG
jgi:hypothetical protein